MKVEKLLRMANEIARNLRSLPGEQPIIASAEHLRSFWTPGMRSSLIAYMNADGAGLDPIAIAALRQLQQGNAQST